MMKKGLLTLAVALLALVPASAVAAMRGGFGFGFGGPWIGPGYGWYAPYPYYAPYYGGYWYAPPSSGSVKLDTKVKNAQLFIDGAFAGDTGSNKTMHLRPGKHEIQIQEAGQTRFDQQVYVSAGQTVKLHPEL